MAWQIPISNKVVRNSSLANIKRFLKIPENSSPFYPSTGNSEACMCIKIRIFMLNDLKVRYVSILKITIPFVWELPEAEYWQSPYPLNK